MISKTINVQLLDDNRKTVERIKLELSELGDAGIIEWDCRPFVFQRFDGDSVIFQEVNKLAFLGGVMVT